MLATVGLAVSACDITRYTTDTVSRFTASTSPGDILSADGLIKEQYKAFVFTTLNADNLRQDIAQGHGEYLNSLSVLLHVPMNERPDFFRHAQEQYSTLYASDTVTPEDALSALTTVSK
jgi:hypothetical protein